jgi:hypothetical protein
MECGDLSPLSATSYCISQKAGIPPVSFLVLEQVAQKRRAVAWPHSIPGQRYPKITIRLLQCYDFVNSLDYSTARDQPFD